MFSRRKAEKKRINLHGFFFPTYVCTATSAYSRRGLITPPFPPMQTHTRTQTLVHMGRGGEGSLDYVGSGGQGGRNRAHLENIEPGAGAKKLSEPRGSEWGGGVKVGVGGG